MNRDYIAALCNYAKVNNLRFTTFLFVMTTLNKEAKTKGISIYDVLDEYLNNKDDEYTIVECGRSVDKAIVSNSNRIK